MVTFYQFVRDALLIAAGTARRRAAADVQGAARRADPEGARAAPSSSAAILAPDGDGGWTVRTTGDQGSGILSSMSRANCFVVLPPETGELRGGDLVDVQLLEGHRSATPRTHPRRGVPLLAEARLHQLRRPGRADRDHASRSRRDAGAGSPSGASCTRSTTAWCCPAPRRSSSPPTSAGCMHRTLGRHRRRRAVRAAVAAAADRAVVAVHGVRRRAGGRRHPLRHQAGGGRDRRCTRRGGSARARCKHPALWAIAALAFVAIFALHVPFPAIVLARRRARRDRRPHRAARASRTGGHAGADDAAHPPGGDRRRHADARARALPLVAARARRRRLRRPVAVRAGDAGRDATARARTLPRMGWFFTKAALLTFGGAYAVLPYVYQGAVETYALAHAGADDRRPRARRDHARAR